jgi:diacylglycerol O-acyltransferase
MGDVEAIPLSDEDRAILALEGPAVAGHTCKTIMLGTPAPGLDQLRALIGSRIERVPALTRRLGGEEEPAWVPDPDFDVRRHVTPVSGPAVGEARLTDVVAGLFERRLPRDRPLWQIDLARLDDGRAALVWRLHHAVADGTSAMRFGRELLWDAEDAAGKARPSGRATLPAHDDARRRGHLGAFIRREFGESRHRSPFDREIGPRRRIGFAAVPLQPLHDAAKQTCGATLNDAVLAVVAGALRRWLEHHHGSLGSVRLRVPVSLHSEGDQAGNRDSFFTVPVSLHEPDPVVRLREVCAQTAERKHAQDAEQLTRYLAELGRASPRLERLAVRIEAGGRSFALAVSNVPGPPRPVSVLGARVETMHSVAEIGRHHALRIAVVSLAGALCFGFSADAAVIDDLGAMARGVEAEAAELVAAGR